MGERCLAFDQLQSNLRSLKDFKGKSSCGSSCQDVPLFKKTEDRNDIHTAASLVCEDILTPGPPPKNKKPHLLFVCRIPGHLRSKPVHLENPWAFYSEN
jgi:hypothetical protein